MQRLDRQQSGRFSASAFNALRLMVPLLFFSLKFADWWRSDANNDRPQAATAAEEKPAAGIDAPFPSALHDNSLCCSVCKRLLLNNVSVIVNEKSGQMRCGGCVADMNGWRRVYWGG